MVYYVTAGGKRIPNLSETNNWLGAARDVKAAANGAAAQLEHMGLETDVIEEVNVKNCEYEVHVWYGDGKVTIFSYEKEE